MGFPKDKKPKKTYTLNNFAKKELRKQQLSSNENALKEGLKNASFSYHPVDTTTFEPPLTQNVTQTQPIQQTEATDQPQNYLLQYGNSGLPNSEVSTLLGSVLTGQTQQNLYDNVLHSLGKMKEGAESLNLDNAGLNYNNALAGLKFMNGLAGLSFFPITAVNEVMKQNPVTDWLNKGAMLPFELADELYTLTQKGTDYAFEKITGHKPDRSDPLSQELDEFLRTSTQLLIGGKAFHETGKFFKKGMPEVKEVKTTATDEFANKLNEQPETIPETPIETEKKPYEQPATIIGEQPKQNNAEIDLGNKRQTFTKIINEFDKDLQSIEQRLASGEITKQEFDELEKQYNETENKKKTWQKRLDEIQEEPKPIETVTENKRPSNDIYSEENIKNPKYPDRTNEVTEQPKTEEVTKPTEILSEKPKIIKVSSLKTDEGKFSNYDIEQDVKGRANMFTVLEDNNGWIVRNALIPNNLQQQGIATEFYKRMNDESIKNTGKPLRSTQPRELITGEKVHEISQEGIKLWDSLVSKGLAEKISDKNYKFKEVIPEPAQVETPTLEAKLPEAENTAKVPETIINKYATELANENLKNILADAEKQGVKMPTDEKIKEHLDKTIEANRKNFQSLLEDIKNKDYKKLSSRLHTGNKKSRKFFKEVTGLDIGKTNTETKIALQKFTGAKEEPAIPKEKTALEKYQTTLSKKVRYNGKVMTNAEFLDSEFNNGYRVKIQKYAKTKGNKGLVPMENEEQIKRYENLPNTIVKDYYVFEKDNTSFNLSKGEYEYIKEKQDVTAEKEGQPESRLNEDLVYKALNKLYEIDDLPTIKTEKNIKLSDINNGVGQQIEDAINNVKNGLENKTKGKPLVVESEGKYYIQDGFHRIARAIINNEDNIVVDIIYKKPKNIAEAYHKAKLTNDNPELIKKTEDILKADTEPYFETEEGKRLIEQPKPEEVTEPTEVLSEKEFNKKYKAQHKDVRSKTEDEKLSVKGKIVDEGFNQSMNVNALPIFKKPDNAVSEKYGNKKGDIIYLLPKDAIEDKPNGYQVKKGHKPLPSDIIRIEYDNQPTYEAYKKQILNKLKTEEVVTETKQTETPTISLPKAEFENAKEIADKLEPEKAKLEADLKVENSAKLPEQEAVGKVEGILEKPLEEITEQDTTILQEEYNRILDKNYLVQRDKQTQQRKLKKNYDKQDLELAKKIKDKAIKYNEHTKDKKEKANLEKATNLLKEKGIEGRSILIPSYNMDGIPVAGRDGKIYIRQTDVTEKIQSGQFLAPKLLSDKSLPKPESKLKEVKISNGQQIQELKEKIRKEYSPLGLSGRRNKGIQSEASKKRIRDLENELNKLVHKQEAVGTANPESKLKKVGDKITYKGEEGEIIKVYPQDELDKKQGYQSYRIRTESGERDIDAKMLEQKTPISKNIKINTPLLNLKNTREKSYYEGVSYHNGEPVVEVAYIFNDGGKLRQDTKYIPYDKFEEKYHPLKNENEFKKVNRALRDAGKFETVKLGGLTEAEKLKREQDKNILIEKTIGRKLIEPESKLKEVKISNEQQIQELKEKIRKEYSPLGLSGRRNKGIQSEASKKRIRNLQNELNKLVDKKETRRQNLAEKKNKSVTTDKDIIPKEIVDLYMRRSTLTFTENALKKQMGNIELKGKAKIEYDNVVKELSEVESKIAEYEQSKNPVIEETVAKNQEVSKASLPPSLAERYEALKKEKEQYEKKLFKEKHTYYDSKTLEYERKLDKLQERIDEVNKTKSIAEKKVGKVSEQQGGKQTPSISPNKEVKVSVKIATEEVTKEFFPDVKPSLAQTLYSTNKNGLDELAIHDKPEGLKEVFLKQLIDKDLIEGTYKIADSSNFTDNLKLTEKGKELLRLVEARLETRRNVKAGTDMFPEHSNIPEIKEKYNNSKQIIKDALKKDSGISFGGLSKLGDLADPKVLKAVYDVAKYHYENGAKNIREFANKVIEDLGEWVKPHLKELWKKAKEEPLANKNAKKYFGTTNYIKEAGYITPKGELLDLSGKNQGGEPFTRALDHREISQASEGLTDMREFIDLGNVRFLPESSTFDILKPLTRKQEKVMTAIIRHYKGDVAIEVQNGKGEYRPEYQMHVNSGRELGKVYPKGTSPKVVFDDIRKFFEEEGTFKKRETEYQTALKSLQEKINRANMTFGLDTLPEVYTIAKYHTGKFAEWSKKVIKDVGNWIRPHLRNLYQEITKDRTGLNNVVTQGLKIEPIKQEVKDSFSGAVDKIKRGADTIRKIIAPVTRGENAKLTAKIITEKNAELVRQEAIISEGFKEARKQFDKRSNADNLKMIDAIETGSEINNPLEKSFADEVRKLLDAEYKKVTDRKGIKSFIENYFPHIWEQDSQNQLQAMLSRRPLEGSKSFLKKRTIPTTREGIEAGLKPVTYNPVDLALLKLHEMKKFNMAHEIMDNLKAEGLVKYIPADYFAPAGWTKLNDKIGTIFGDPGITATEYVDKHLYNALEKLATDLNIKHSRVAELRGTRMGEASPAGYVNTKYATPEDVLAHEIGHHLQFKYNLWDYLTGDIHVEGRNKTDTLKKTRQERVKIHKELRALADLRAKGEKVSDSHKRYLREKDEKMAVVLQAYTHIPAEMREVAPTIFSKFEKFIDSKPELRQIKQIKPSLVPKEMDMKYDKNGILIKGHYYLPEPAARIINNHLSPGLKGEPVFDIYRGISNTLNQVQLGASLFHASFTSGDANLSKLALGLMKISRGKKEGLLDIATSPIAFITNPVEGNKIRKDYLSDRPNNPELVNAITRAGGRISMDRFYTNDLYTTVKKAFKDGKYISGSLKAPFAMFEVLSKPVLEYLVPRQKLGVFSGLAKDILQDEASGKLTKTEATERLQEAWRSVDNRMGQLVYDNLYWDHVVKDIAMASVRSVGWNLGTFRELGGGIRDIPKIITEKRLTPRTAYALALPFGIGLLGAVYSYLNGTPAESIKDLYFPRTGHKNKDGVDDRISLPSYMKDVFAYGTDIKSALNTRDLGAGAKTLSHKMHPAISMLLDLINNHDYFGNEISDNTPFSPEWFVDEAKYIAQQFRPFTVNNISEMNKQGEPLSKQLQSFFGFQLAPGYIRRSDMQNKIYDTYQKRNGEKIISKPEAETRELKRELKDLYLKDKNAYDEKIADLLEEGKISSRELNSIESDKPTDIKLFKYLPADDKIELWNQMNKEEKQRYQDGLTNKIRKTLNLPYKIPSNAPKGIIEKATPEQYTEYENEAEKRIMQFEKENKGMDKDELQKQRNRIRKDIREEMNLETEKEKKKTHLYIPGQQNYFNQPKTFKNHLTIPK